MATYPYDAQLFYQYGNESTEPSGRLIAFSAPASEIVKWAGVPRKGWTLRALYQRVLDSNRIAQVSDFFTPSGSASRGNLSPTAVTIALVDPNLSIPNESGLFELQITSPDPPSLDNAVAEIQRISGELFPAHVRRLSSDVRLLLERYSSGAVDRNELESSLRSDDYVAMFAADLISLSQDAGQFLSDRGLNEAASRDELLDALYDLSKPALIVDGQHRVFGAARASGPSVSILICAMPNCSWEEQAFQFVVINEEAKPVEVTVLYDIFGSSLTREEAERVRRQLGPSGDAVERRIAAVVAYRDGDSPFANMVRLQVRDLPIGVTPYLSPRLIVDLINGSRSCRGIRSDDAFMSAVVRPTLGNQDDGAVWTSWADGKWRPYWYAFWRAVRDYFNEGEEQLWNAKSQSNLTKGVSLKALQDLILGEMISQARANRRQEEDLRKAGVDEATLAKVREGKQLPATPELFYQRTKENFLRGFPHGFFKRRWVRSLDTSAGMEALRTVLKETWSSYVDTEGSRKYPYWKNAQVFESAPDREARASSDEEDA